MKRITFAILIIVIYASSVGLFWATSVRTLTIYPAIDSYSWQSVPNGNNGGSDNFEITSYDKPPDNMRGWIEFNLPTLPSDGLLISAELRLRIWHKTTDDPSQALGDPTGRVYGVYALTQPWEEFNITWANQPNYTEVDHAEAAVPSGQSDWYGPLLYMNWDITPIVKHWMSGMPNYGLLVRDTHENASTLYSTQFFTHDKTPNKTYYPALLITYTTLTSLGLLVTLLVAETVTLFLFWKRQTGRRGSDGV